MQKESLKNEFTIKSNFSNKFYNMREHKHGNTKTKVSHLILKYRLVSIVFYYSFVFTSKLQVLAILRSSAWSYTTCSMFFIMLLMSWSLLFKNSASNGNSGRNFFASPRVSFTVSTELVSNLTSVVSFSGHTSTTSSDSTGIVLETNKANVN